uniref:ribosomal protein S11 n=1 Tax=Prototheca cookei TaxID=2509259 RepID=UPI0030023757
MANKYKTLQEKEKQKRRRKKKIFIQKTLDFSDGKLYIQSLRNNLILSLTDINGNVLRNSSTGTTGAKGYRKRLLANKVKLINKMLYYIKRIGIKQLHLIFKGFGRDRELICRNIKKIQLTIESIYDYTSMPHNGCRLRKKKSL